MLRKLLAILLVNGFMLEPVQQVLQPLYASEPAVRLASLGSEPKAEPFPEKAETAPVAAEQREVREAQVIDFATAGDLGLAVFVGFADNATPSVDFPTPWQGSPNVVYIGGGAPVNAGAIRLDNHSGAPLTVDRVDVDLQRANAHFSLWQGFTIPAGGSAVLTQTAPGNFDTSAYPIAPCGGTLPAGETRIPKVTVTSGGSSVTLLDSAHVLDTGGFDSSCRGNESVQWREIGTRGIEVPSGDLILGPSNSSGSGGSPVTLRAHLQDPNGAPLPNVVVEFRAVSGPNAGESGKGVIDSQGNAQFTYVGTAQGADLVRAAVTNASGAPVQSNDVTVTWKTASCGPDVPLPRNGEASLLYTGGTRVQYSDSIELAALLSNPLGEPVAGQTLRFSFGGQTFGAATDATGIARVAVTAAVSPAELQVTVDFAGGSGLPALRATQTVTVEREDVLLEYTAKTLLGTAVPQPVSARLRDPDSLTPIAGKTVTFSVGTVTATAVTDGNGVAATTITLGPNQMSGPSSLTVSFAGDVFYEPAFRTVAVTIYLSTSFVIWGGNDAGLKLGQRVNFWGSQWKSQVLQGQAISAFKGLADPVSQIHICQPSATQRDLTPTCWVSKGGQTFPPPISVPAYIEVIVSTVIAKQGSDIYGNIAAAAVVKVDPQPPYGPDPGKPGYGVIVAVIEDTATFPAPAMVKVSQTQPRTVLPNEQITLAATVSNASTATAATGLVLSETLAGLSPATASETLGTINPGASRTVEFRAATPGVPTRENNESAADYIRRLSSLNGRVYTAAGQVTFTDPNGQVYLPVEVSTRSVLAIPVLTLALSGPAVASPGLASPYKVTVTNIGSAPATATVHLTMPDGTARTFDVASLAAGSSFTQIVSFTPPALEGKKESETTADYLARLKQADGEILRAKAEVSWSDASGNRYGDVGQRIFTSRIRVPILELTAQAPSELLPMQTADVNLAVRNTGGCTAVLSQLATTNPDGSTTTAPQFVLAAGEATTIKTSWHVPQVPKRDDDGESDAQYQARLKTIDGSPLDFRIHLGWSDPAGTTYGTTSADAHSREVLSIVPITLTGPATAPAGSTITYTVAATNVGSAPAPQVDLTVSLPNGSIQKPVVGSLAPGATFQTTIDYAIPTTQAAGMIRAEASDVWTDPGHNAYGPLSASASTEVTNSTVFNSLALTPAIAGPNVKGTSQTMTATLKTVAGVPIPNATVQFNVTGANPTSGTGTTDSSGAATFTYSGANAGADTVQTTSGSAVSNTATVSWITPVQSISTTPMFARFFATDGSGAFNTPATATPAFIQSFPTINFNPPGGTVPGNTSGVNTGTRPFIDVTTDLNGNFTGTIIAQGNGLQAGVGSLFNFQAVFTGSFIVASAGDMPIDVFSDDGFVLGIGGGATRVSGPLFNVPAGGITEFEKLPVLGAFNAGSGPTGRRVVVHFPAAGTYPYEMDYSECCGGELALTVAAGNVTGRGVAPTGSLKLSPINLTAQPTGQTQTLTVDAFDGSGLPVANTGVALVINGPNSREVSATTDASGHAVFTYTGFHAGTDTAQAIARVAGLGTFSNVVNVPWTAGTGDGGDPNLPGGNFGEIVTQGWIGGPLHGSTLKTPTAIVLASSEFLFSGVLDFWPSLNPAEVHVLNPNTTGSGTIGTFDPTMLANGEYTIRLRGTTVGRPPQTSLVVVHVTGDLKPGRVTLEVTDLRVPVVGMPVTISRHYDSLERGKVGDFGYGWSLQTSVRLEVNKENDVTFSLNGRRQTFQFNPQPGAFPFPFLLSPKWVPEPGTFGTLTSDGCGALTLSGGTFSCLLDIPGSFAPSNYTYTDPYGRQYVMGHDGQIKSIKDLNGTTLTFTRDGITSSMGGLTVPFVRDAQGRITQITDPNGKIFLYSYDAVGDLVSVKLPDIDTPLKYEYAPGHFFLKGIDARGNPEATTTYYADGRLQSQTDAVGKTTAYAYNLTSNTTTITQPDNTGTTVQRYDANGLVLSTTDPLGRTTSYTYDANLNKRTETDALGKTTTYDYDANGNLRSVTDPLNKTKSFTRNEFGQPVTATDQLGKIKTLRYDDNHNLSSASDELGVQMALTSSESGNPLTFGDANGKVARFTYDAYGNILSKTDSLGHITSYTYDTMGRALTMTDPRGVTRFGYDALGRMLTVIDPLSNETRYEYDSNGNRTAVIDAKDRTTRYEYDAANRVSKITYPDGTSDSYTYNFRGQKETATVTGPVATATEPFSRITTYRYDNAGQLVKVIYPDLSEIKFAYDEVGRIKTVTDELNKVFTYGYDPACGCRDRLTQIIDPSGNSISYTYDAAGRRISLIDALARETRYTYDVRNRLTKTTFADNTFEETTFDGMGRRLAFTDQEGRTTRFAYDDVGDLLSVTDTQGAATQYTYDAFKNLLSSTDANSHTTSFGYDALNRLIKRVLPLGMAEIYTYDPVGNLATRINFKGQQTSYDFDSMNRLTARRPDTSLGEPAILYSYTETGKRRSMIDASGTTTYTYDQRDRLITKQAPQGTLTYGYDLAGELTSMRSSNTDGVSVNYTYDDVNRLENVIDHRLAAGTTTYTYDAVGNLKSDSRPNGVRADYTYDVLNRLTSLGVTSGGTPQASYAYTLDQTGRRLSVLEGSGRAVNYTYDAIYRLTGEAVSGSQNSSGNGAVDYTYDPVGNRLSRISSLSAVLSATSAYDANNRLLSDVYDANGNTTGADGRTFVYDFENRIKSADGGAVRITYDGDGNLAAKTVGGVTTQYLVDDLNPTGYSQVVEEIINGQVQQQYTYGHTILSQRRWLGGGWAVSFYSMDGHGSVRQLTDPAGGVTDTYTYDAFGKLISRTGTTPNPYLYAGERFDADLGLYHLRARHYNADRGRFVSMDPYPGDIDDPASLHKYLYANADPINFVDPSGLESEEEVGILRAIALRIATSLRAVGRGISCVLIENASTIASVLGYDEWSSVADLASRLLLPRFCLREPLPRATTTVLSDVTVISRGKVVGRGNVYLGDTIEGIQAGRVTPRKVFENREGLLPSRPPSYYREFDHPTPGVNGRGPQRIVMGMDGDLYYTPDHYNSFIPLN
jgi:RHS repeat-associated protein/uncharacterized repeat protein (TIGR01451 family)